jgi:hypothetical protein
MLLRSADGLSSLLSRQLEETRIWRGAVRDSVFLKLSLCFFLATFFLFFERYSEIRSWRSGFANVATYVKWSSRKGLASLFLDRQSEGALGS